MCISYTFRCGETKSKPGDGTGGRRKAEILEVEVDAGWPLSPLQQALSQAWSLLYKVELLITQEQEERWCFLFVGVQLFWPAPSTAGSL